MMPGRRSKVPDDWVSILREKGPPYLLVDRPCADVGCGRVTNVIVVETDERAHRRLLQQTRDAIQAFSAEPVEIDALLPVNTHQPPTLESHCLLLSVALAPTPSIPGAPKRAPSLIRFNDHRNIPP